MHAFYSCCVSQFATCYFNWTINCSWAECLFDLASHFSINNVVILKLCNKIKDYLYTCTPTIYNGPVCTRSCIDLILIYKIQIGKWLTKRLTTIYDHLGNLTFKLLYSVQTVNDSLVIIKRGQCTTVLQTDVKNQLVMQGLNKDIPGPLSPHSLEFLI